jgi:uncharacterized protein (TIGR03437 family)
MAQCSNVFLAKLNPQGSALVYSTYLGASGGDGAYAVAVDSQGAAYVVGAVESGDYPITTSAAQHCNGHYSFVSGGTGFLTVVAANGAMTFSTFLGGTYFDQISAAAASGQQVYLAGITGSKDFPVTPGAIQPVYGGFNSDGFAAVIDLGHVYTGGPRIDPVCVQNGAALQSEAISPGEIVSIFGSGLGPSIGVGAQLDNQGAVSKNLAGVTVTFDGLSAPVLWAQDNQVNAIVPFAVSGKSATQVVVAYQGEASPAVTQTVTPAAAGIFTLNSNGAGQAAALNQDGSLNGPSNPAARGSVLTFFMTGGGLLTQTYEDGQITPLVPASLIIAPQVYVELSPQAQVLYAGQAP